MFNKMFNILMDCQIMEMISLFCYLFMLWKIIGMNIKLVILFLATRVGMNCFILCIIFY